MDSCGSLIVRAPQQCAGSPLGGSVRAAPTSTAFANKLIQKAKNAGIDGLRARQGYIASTMGFTNFEPATRCRRHLCESLARLSRIPGDPRLGALLVHQPGGDVRHHLRNCKAINPKVQVGWHHASRYHESLLYADTNYAGLCMSPTT